MESTTIIFALLLGSASLVLGAAFSGTETAFYRVSKLRLKLDALGGDATAKRFLWYANNPSFLLATLLVGNNTTTYTASVAMVLFVGCIMPHADGIYAELAATLILTPILFVWGEMFPKSLGLTIPNRVLRFFDPVIQVASVVFLPLTAILWAINKAITLALKQSGEAFSLSLCRRELSVAMTEGIHTGILSDTQRQLAEGIFACSESLIVDYAIPQSELPSITTAMNPADALDLASRHHLLALPVYESDAAIANRDLPMGYVRAIELEIAARHKLDEQSRQLSQLLQTELPIRSIVELSSKHSLLTGLILLQTMQASFGCVVDSQRRCLGFVSADQLRDVLLETRKDA